MFQNLHRHYKVLLTCVALDGPSGTTLLGRSVFSDRSLDNICMMCSPVVLAINKCLAQNH